jgi:hypothetical protein
MNEAIKAAASQIAEELTHELGAAIAAVVFALKRQTGIDAETLTSDMKEYLESYSQQSGREPKIASVLTHLADGQPRPA